MVSIRIEEGRRPMKFHVEIPNPFHASSTTKPLLSRPLRRLLVPGLLASAYLQHLLYRYGRYKWLRESVDEILDTVL